MEKRKPCDRVLPVLGAESNIVQHMRALPHQDVAAAVETVRTSGSVAPAVRLATGERDGHGGPGWVEPWLANLK